MYKIKYSPLALEDYEKSIFWYNERTLSAAENFVDAVQVMLTIIKKNPKQFKCIYKKYYETSLNKYPFTIVYTIEEREKQILIVAIYHQKRNPGKKYKR